MREPRGPHYINVDLEVWSREDLAPLAKALESRVFVLNVGKVRGKFFAGFEAQGGRSLQSPEQTIRELLTVVEDLPPLAKRLWRRALSREFNVGYGSGEILNLLFERPVGSGCWYAKKSGDVARAFETSLSPELLRAVANVGGAIATTIYPPAREVAVRRRRTARTSRESPPAKPVKRRVGRGRPPTA